MGARGGYRGGRRSKPHHNRKPTGRRLEGLNDGKPCSVDEKTVGISCFRSPLPGFKGTVKQRFSDFIVREIDRQGQVVQLTKLPPKKIQIRRVGLIKHALSTFLSENHPALGPVFRSIQQFLRTREKRAVEEQRQLKVAAIVSEFNAIPGFERLNEFLADPEAQDFRLCESDREKRTKLHGKIRDVAGDLVVADSFKNDAGESEGIRIRHKHNKTLGKRDNFDYRNKTKEWPVDRPDYLQFVLHKTNQDMSGALEEIKRTLHLREGRIEVAGTKDKRGITSQLAQLYRVKKEQLAGFNRELGDLNHRKILVGNLQYTNDSIKLGDLQGNEFTVVVRNVSVADEFKATEDETIAQCAESLKQKGFINYFGLQRFGTASVATHEVGRALLQQNWELAVDLILKPREGDPSAIARARTVFAKTKDANQALKMFPRFLVGENAVLNGLSVYGDNQYRKALDRIPRHLRMMYTHAYQSFIWNSAASYRIEQYGENPVVGDLIVESGTESLYHQSFEQEDEKEEEQAVKKIKFSEIRVRSLTAQDIDAGTYTLQDIVLPLPGASVSYPENTVSQVYSSLLKKDGVQFQASSGFSELSLSGGYRPVIAPCRDFTYRIVRYDDFMLPLIPTDIDLMNGIQQFDGKPNGKFKALCCTFRLPSSSYATMCLRELMKMTSDVQTQMTQNNKAPSILIGQSLGQSIVRDDN